MNLSLTAQPSDSLLKINSKNLSDTIAAAHEHELSQAWRNSNLDSALVHTRNAIQIYRRSLNKGINNRVLYLLGRQYLHHGILLKNSGSVFEAKSEYEKAKFIFEYLQSALDVAEALNDIGLVYYQLGEMNTSVKYLYRSVRILDSIGDFKSSSYCYLNLASVHDELGNKELAMEYYKNSESIFMDMNDLQGLAYVHNNIGYLYERMKAYQQALEHDIKSYNYSEKLGDKRSMSYAIANMGSVYYAVGNYDQALRCYTQSLQLREEVGDKSGIAFSNENMSEIALVKGEMNKAEEHAQRALDIANELGYPELIMRSARMMERVKEKKGDYKSALELYKLSITMRDSLQSQQNRDETVRQSMLLNFSKKENEFIREQEQKEIVHREASKRQRLIIISVSITLILIAVFAILLYRRFRITRLQKREIEFQKAIVDEKNREILDSISYAKRLQDAILPPIEDFRRSLGEADVLYLPKDIVAGDFFFLEQLNSKIIFGVADCTGHGVPGAMVSVVCSNALSKTILEEHVTDPGLILDAVSVGVEKTFSKSSEEVRDGMDISLACFDPSDYRLTWAGANNPLWIIRNQEILEWQGDKQSIGGMDIHKSFTTHQTILQKNDLLLMFSDGYADQFGGDRGKKMRVKGLKEVLQSCSSHQPAELISFLHQAFHQWKGNHEQIDDVCVLAIRIS